MPKLHTSTTKQTLRQRPINQQKNFSNPRRMTQMSGPIVVATPCAHESGMSVLGLVQVEAGRK